jgi:hypothetical protein
MHRCLIFLFFFVLSLSVASQNLDFDAEINLQSRHVWRGSQLGDAIAIEPSVTIGTGRFSFNIWAARTTNNSYSEIDLIPSYQFHYFNLTLLDYYNPVPGENNQYLTFQEGENRHSVELNINNYSIEKQRVKWMIGTFVLGDMNNETGKPYYSTYLEFKYPFAVLGIETKPFAGLTPFRGYYADKFALMNTGITFSKDFDLSSRFSIPINMSLISNPYQNNYFLTFSTGIVFSGQK